MRRLDRDASCGTPGLLGKVPAQADFIRVNTGDPAAQELERWLEEAHEALRPLGAALPPGPTCFCFPSAASRAALVGALIPSVDKVGRAFPLAVFVPVDAAALGALFPLAPLAVAGFMAQARGLLLDAPRLDAAGLSTRVRALVPPGAAEWALAREQREAILAGESRPLLSALTQAGQRGGPHYAFRTFAQACAQAPSADTRARVVLDCPLGGEGPLPWLELALGTLGPRPRPPSFFWGEEPSPRLLLALGGAPAALLSFLARPEAASQALWPLRTPRAAALETAFLAFGEPSRGLLEDGTASLGELLSALVSRSAGGPHVPVP